MKYKINPYKLAKAPARIMPFLFAEIEFDDSSPCFSLLRQYMQPATSEERWSELVETFKARSRQQQWNAEARFDAKLDKIIKRMTAAGRAAGLS